MDKYRLLTYMVSPLLPAWIFLRRLRGKEDAVRWRERFGFASAPRPDGKLLWLHAASVGEANSVLQLIEKIRGRVPSMQVLLTTGTVTSARLMQKRLPKGAIHHYVPLDTPQATRRFMDHWRPDFAFWIESEFWPNLVRAADDSGCFMGVINARMSVRSFIGWQKRPAMIARILSCFDCLFAQSQDDAARLKTLGARHVMYVGNLKYDAAILPCDELELIELKTLLGARPLWLAASTHPGEEHMVASAHAQLAKTHPGLLTVIVPRHPHRGAELAAELAKHARVALRSRKNAITPETEFYVADTLGELGLFYRLCEIVFVGGSLVKRGGQNPLEPARLACAVVTGPYIYNFSDIYQDMESAGACLRVHNAQELAVEIGRLLGNASAASAMQARAKQWVEGKSGATAQLLDLLQPVFLLRATTS